MEKLRVENLNFKVGKVEILKDVSFSVKENSFVGVIGHNGSGKSTMLKTIYGVNKPTGGKIFFDEHDLFQLSGRERAKKIAVLAQESGGQFDFSVQQVVEMGRYPHKDTLENYSKEDLEKVDKVLHEMKLEDYRDRSFNTLSGGEKQRVLIARLLVQESKFIILDEPTNHLDIKSKNVLKKALQQFEGTLIIVSHDRDFLQGLTDKVYEFKNQHLKEYLGDIDFYLEQRAVANFREIEQPKEITTTAKAAQTPEKLSFEEQKQQKAAQNKLNKIERNITDLEQELKAMNEQMGQGLQTDTFYKQYEQKKQQLEDLMTEWESLMS